MPHLHNAKGYSLEMHHTNWNFISCQKHCGRLSQHLSSFYHQRQWQQHPNISCSTLQDIRDSPARFYGFSLYAWNPRATVPIFLISASSQIKTHFLPGEPCPLAKPLTTKLYISLTLIGFCLLRWVINSYEL